MYVCVIFLYIFFKAKVESANRDELSEQMGESNSVWQSKTKCICCRESHPCTQIVYWYFLPYQTCVVDQNKSFFINNVVGLLRAMKPSGSETLNHDTARMNYSLVVSIFPFLSVYTTLQSLTKMGSTLSLDERKSRCIKYQIVWFILPVLGITTVCSWKFLRRRKRFCCFR